MTASRISAPTRWMALLLCIGEVAATPLDDGAVPVQTLDIKTPSQELRQRYLGAQNKGVYLVRPDQHVVARWSHFDAAAIKAALAATLGKGN